MNLIEALGHIIKSKTDKGMVGLLVDNKEAADEISQLIIDNGGHGCVYGKYVSNDRPNGWYEVLTTVPEQVN